MPGDGKPYAVRKTAHKWDPRVKDALLYGKAKCRSIKSSGSHSVDLHSGDAHFATGDDASLAREFCAKHLPQNQKLRLASRA
jgi:hypothetical protein